jgi:WD40 repeat protein
LRIVTASDDNTARVWDISTIPKGNILQVASALLRMHEDRHHRKSEITS